MSNTHICGRRGPPGPFKIPDTDHYKEDGRCSYCGSVSQESFLAFVRAGGEVGPTDKSYKVYLKSVDQGVVAPGIKFYFQHLNDDGERQFIELYNQRLMRLGYPHYFYTKPYFCAEDPK